LVGLSEASGENCGAFLFLSGYKMNFPGHPPGKFNQLGNVIPYQLIKSNTRLKNVVPKRPLKLAQPLKKEIPHPLIRMRDLSPFLTFPLITI
jgi:hypothetical protein